MDFDEVRFVYNEPAMIISDSGDEYLVVGDLHIGVEKRFMDSGVQVFDATERMAKRIKSLMSEFGLHRLVLLGDIKESILHPDKSELGLIRLFFRELEGYEVTVVAGNHDAFISEIVGARALRELQIGKFFLTHGDKLPGASAMQASYIVAAHMHVAVGTMDRNGVVHRQKAWLVAAPNQKTARAEYGAFNKGIRLIVMPAFNDLITGSDVNERSREIIPLFGRNIFGYRKAFAYDLTGQPLRIRAVPRRTGGSGAAVRPRGGRTT